MNQTVLSGNLTADIETRDIETRDIQSSSGGRSSGRSSDQHISQFTLACNEGERVVFMPVEAWNMPHLAEYLFKGSKALVSGALKQEKWETEAGDKRSRIVLTAYKVEFLDPAPEGSQGNQGSGAARSQAPRGRGNAPARRSSARARRPAA